MDHGFGTIGYIAALLTTFSSILQIIRVFRLKESRDISLIDSVIPVCGDPPLVHPWDCNRGFSGYHCKRGLLGVVRSHDLPGGKISVRRVL